MDSHTLSRFSRRRQHRTENVLDVYSVRLSLGLITSLLLVLALTRLPVRESPNRVGWGQAAAHEQIHLSEIRPTTEDDVTQKEQTPPASNVPITVQNARDNAPPDEVSAASEEPSTETSTTEDLPLDQRAVQLTALGPSGETPQFIGGRNAFYLRIHYPEAARRQGIEGLVILEFIVDADGVTHDIRIAKSLHALCDSSAVNALRQTRFVPAERNGEAVAVRMRLPVRFQLINYMANTADSRPYEPPPNPL